jgi:Ca2+/H+ antiporter, TMEM165/GDT1 family
VDPVVAATAFVLIFPAELPDKTFVATLVLATRFPPRAVWLGVVSAFFLQCLVAVTAGHLLSLLPRRPVLAATATLFAVGATVLLRGAGHAEQDEAAGEREFGRRVGSRSAHGRAALASFGVLFAAEWGDLSQLLTAGLAARYREPVSVFAGSWLALACVAGVAVLAGRALLARVRLSLVRRVAGSLFALLAVYTAVEAVRAG